MCENGDIMGPVWDFELHGENTRGWAVGSGYLEYVWQGLWFGDVKGADERFKRIGRALGRRKTTK